VIAIYDGVLFSTPHYDGHGGMVVRLADIDRDYLFEVMEDAYQMVAPKTLIRALDGRAAEEKS
jgi:hypothetical protein